MRANSLLGYRDPLTVSAYVAEGTLSGIASYDFPFTTRGARLGVSYSFNQIEIISGPTQDLDIKGRSQDVGFNLSRPLMVGRLSKLDGYVAFHKKKSETDFSSITLYETEVDNYIGGLDYQLFDTRGFLNGGVYLTYGSDNYTDEKQFWRINANFLRLLTLKNKMDFIFRGSAQASDTDLLPPSEQFQIGGQSSVRGYSEGLKIGDSGYFLSAEMNYPLDPNIKAALFIDHGGAFPTRAADSLSTKKTF